jgi:thiamine biosynthesis protein ThiS
MSHTITVMVNGKERQLEAGRSLSELLDSLDLDPRTVVVELNREIVRRPKLDETKLNDGDSIELVHFVGGG